MSRINIERESSQRNINVKMDNINTHNIGISKNNSNEDFSNNEENDNMGLNFLINDSSRNEQQYEREQIEDDLDEENNKEDSYQESYRQESVYEDPGMSFEEIQAKKAILLSKIRLIATNDHPVSRRLGVEHSLDEISMEYERIKTEINLEEGIKYAKQGLMFCVTSMEMLNNRFDPVGANLDGWSNVVMMEQEKKKYDGVCLELYEKYGGGTTMGPELKLISMLGASAFMFHLQKSLVDKALNKPGVEEKISKFMNKREMSGLSMGTEDILNSLGDSDDSDNSSVASSIPEVKPKRKQGRPRKTKIA